ncbi:hypothetical protein O1611_g4048 [Lasiodiplodia mahajangana]|uniref:Uncharacterized protein n=1 Tax=Lasiodiplodia mahajangana TaxID=1108764 RepID=A0ACC2JQB5_9PEZI|nr:hypothetical protein O1611_g4048 [Lasiodiplodia mahajangana]
MSHRPFRGGGEQVNIGEHNSIFGPGNSASQLLRARSQSPTSYEIALNELEELESEPLCHRIAARLLVNNCQLLEGKDEATVLTDSGRKIRDFVDSYAASLAICDLERGRFTIPPECTKLQEPTLSQLPIQKAAHLHITSTEIDECLSGLGASDSAWNTWVSYRHKALRFCEAARADNDKAQNIILFQRLTKIMSKLTDDVDAKIEERMNDLDLRTQAAGEKVDSLSPLLEKLQRDLGDAHNILSHQLLRRIKESQDQVNSGLESAAQLEKTLQIILKGAVDSHAEAVAVHDQSLELMNQRTTSEMEIMVGAFSAAVAATVALRNQIESSRVQAAELESRQDSLEQGMQRLIDISDTLTSKYDVHTGLLQQAQNITNDILDTLEETAASASDLGDSFSGQRSLASRWPYIWCPVVSLVMGSYGLPPSLLRNLGLLALGETAGFIISSFPSLSFGAIHKPTTNMLRSFIRPLQTTDANQPLSNLTSQI